MGGSLKQSEQTTTVNLDQEEDKDQQESSSLFEDTPPKPIPNQESGATELSSEEQKNQALIDEMLRPL